MFGYQFDCHTISIAHKSLQQVLLGPYWETQIYKLLLAPNKLVQETDPQILLLSSRFHLSAYWKKCCLDVTDCFGVV